MDKQVFAKIGVFVLLGLNVASYYAFWPSQPRALTHETKGPREEKGEGTLLPTKPDQPPTPAKPKEFPIGSLDNVVLLPPPILPKPAEQEIKADEAVNRLLDHIKKDAEAVKVVLPPPMPDKVESPAFPLLRDETKPKPLPPLEAQPLVKDPNVAVTSALTAKVPDDVEGWTLKKEKVAGGQTKVTAKLHNPRVEFRFHCDRVEMMPDGAALVASGGVDLQCNGVRVVCQTLTVEFGPQRLIFAGQVLIYPLQTQPTSALQSDRASWLFPRLHPTPGILGPPR